MRTPDLQRVERCQRGVGEVVARCAIARVAFAIPRIVDRDRAPRLAEVCQLRMPHALVRADPMEEQDGECAAVALGCDADDPGASLDLAHRGMMELWWRFAKGGRLGRTKR